MEDLVVVKATSNVRPRNVVNEPERVKKIIHLTPWDLFLLRLSYVQRGLLFPKPNDTEIDTIISKLKTSLSIALDHFYPFAGQLVKVENSDDNTVSFYVNCDGGGGSGVRFVHAAAGKISLDDVIGYSGSVDGFFGSFFPANGIKNYQGVSNPLLMVQFTEIKDGFFLGFGYNHMVADGTSMWKFMNVWSEICSKDLKSFHAPPLLLRGWFFDGIDYPIHIQDPDTETRCNDSLQPTGLQEIVIHLTKENVLKLKAKANEEIGSEDMKLSSLQAVSAHIWRSTVRHSGKNQEEETNCRLLANMRLRLNPPLPEECFGNVAQGENATTTVRELLDHGLGQAAALINRTVRSMTDENVKTSAKDWVKDAKIPVGFGSSSLVVTSSPRFNVYNNDFGWGKPIAARAGPPYLNGRLAIFQGLDEGSIDLQACLPSEVVVNLLKDAEFLEYVNIV